MSKHLLNEPVALYSVDPTIVWKDGRVFKKGVFVGIFSDADEFQKALNEKTQEANWLPASQRKDWPKEMEFPEKLR